MNDTPSPADVDRQPGKRVPLPPALYGGVDVGATKIEVVLAGDDLEPLAEARAATPERGGPRAVLDAVEATLAEALAQVRRRRLRAVGVGMPGPVDTSSGTVQRCPNIRGWTASFPFGPELSERLGTPVAVDNDVRAALLGEHRAGAMRPYNDVLAVWFGTGVGGAILLQGTVRRGATGSAGEVGHVSASPGGRRCDCGRRGCLEAYAGRAAMERRARERVDKGEKTVLFSLMRKSGRSRLSSGILARALDHGDRLANELVNDAVRAAGPAIASVVNVLDVEAVVIGGGLGARLGQPFVRRIERSMHPFLLRDQADRLPVLPAALGDRSGAVGAVVLAVQARPAPPPRAASSARQ